MNIIDMFSTKFNELSCHDLKKRREEINNEIDKRVKAKTKDINLQYKEKECIIKAKFNEIAKKLGTAIPVDMELTSDIESRLVSHFASISCQCYHEYTYSGKLSFPFVYGNLLDILSVLKEDKEHNLILMLAMQLELKKLEDERLLEISKITRDD